MKIFVPGRICLLGEHSDWAGGYRRINADIEKGYALICGTNQGIYAEVEPHPNALVLTSSMPDGKTLGPYEIPMRAEALLEEAQKGGFFSYAAWVAYQVLTYVTHTLHQHFLACQVIIAPCFLRRSLHTYENAVSRKRRRVAAAAHILGYPGDMLCFQGDVFHVSCRSVHILSRNIFAVQAVYKLAVPAPQGLAFHSRVGYDHRFTAAEVQAADRCFIGHPPAQAQCIYNAFAVAVIIP